MDGKKTYRFTVRFGEERTTDDAEGVCVARSSQRPSRGDIEAILPVFVGSIQQVPPRFSALRVEGRRSYDLARQGTRVALAPRSVRIDAVSLESMPSSDEAIFCVTTGKGCMCGLWLGIWVVVWVVSDMFQSSTLCLWSFFRAGCNFSG